MLIKRKSEPFKEYPVIPEGFVNEGEKAGDETYRYSLCTFPKKCVDDVKYRCKKK